MEIGLRGPAIQGMGGTVQVARFQAVVKSGLDWHCVSDKQ